MRSAVAARLRFVAFCLIALVLPGGVMALGDPRLVDLGALALILSPAAAGLALGAGLGHRDVRVHWREVGAAAVTTFCIAGPALAVSLAAGDASRHDGSVTRRAPGPSGYNPRAERP